MIDFKCPKCGEAMSALDSWAGDTENCPSCESVTRIPDGEPLSDVTANRKSAQPPTVAQRNRSQTLIALWVAMAQNDINPIERK